MITNILDLPFYDQEIGKNKIEFLTSVTMFIKNEDISFSGNRFSNYNKSFSYYSYLNNIGTTIILESSIEIPITSIDLLDIIMTTMIL